jgi:hypothetical protein
MSATVTSPTPTTTATTEARRLTVFSVLAALAVIGWHAQSRPEFRLDWTTAGFVLAVVVLIWPSSRVAFLALAVAEALSVFIALPGTNTNRLLQLFIFSSIASTGFYALARSGFRQLDSADWLELFQPLLRLQLVIVYGLAAWHKLNSDFFNPQLSCSVVLFEKAPFFHLHANSDALRWALILFTIVTEASLPILLTLRRTRNFAVCYGVLFHLSLGLSEFYAFSITMISLLFLFTPDDFCDVALDFWRRRSLLMKTVGTVSALTIAATIIGLNVAAFGPSLADLQHTHGFRSGINMVWGKASYWTGYWLLPLYLGPLALFAWLWYRQPSDFQPAIHSYRPIPTAFWIIPALLIFDGINPYLGLKTDTAFAMYSNLRSEGGRTNHLIWRRPLALANYQEDLVQVVDSNDIPLKLTAMRGWPMPFFDLRRRISYLAHAGTKNISITYIRNGETFHRGAAETDPELSSRPSLLERKLLLFRAIGREGCPH